jgi:hypothetical protein
MFESEKCLDPKGPEGNTDPDQNTLEVTEREVGGCEKWESDGQKEMGAEKKKGMRRQFLN